MIEHPVFIPFGEEHMSAVLTVPDAGEPRGLVLLMPGGGGAPRSHRWAMWTRAARELADRGIASVRMDWNGVGDSTGRTWFSFHELPVEQAVRTARFAMQATGVRVLGAAGNCGGARTALKAAPSLPELRSAVLMLLKPLAGTRSRNQGVARVKSAVKRFAGLDRVVRKAYWRLRARRASPMTRALEDLSHRADLLLMESNTAKAGNLPQFVQSLRARNGHRELEIRELPGGSARAFQTRERQELAVSAVIEWFDRTFPAGTAPADPAELAGSADRPS
jgi:pimeloyl-ACP methyl ester carboxylesterase